MTNSIRILVRDLNKGPGNSDRPDGKVVLTVSTYHRLNESGVVVQCPNLPREDLAIGDVTFEQFEQSANALLQRPYQQVLECYPETTSSLRSTTNLIPIVDAPKDALVL